MYKKISLFWIILMFTFLSGMINVYELWGYLKHNVKKKKRKWKRLFLDVSYW